MKIKEFTVSNSVKKTANYQSAGWSMSLTSDNIDDLPDMKEFINKERDEWKKREADNALDMDTENWLKGGDTKK